MNLTAASSSRYRLLEDKQDKSVVHVNVLKDGDFINEYLIKDYACNCPGCVYHSVQCKHLKMKKAWDKAGRPDRLYDFNNGKLFEFLLTEDGSDGVGAPVE